MRTRTSVLYAFVAFTLCVGAMIKHEPDRMVLLTVRYTPEYQFSNLMVVNETYHWRACPQGDICVNLADEVFHFSKGQLTKLATGQRFGSTLAEPGLASSFRLGQVSLWSQKSDYEQLTYDQGRVVWSAESDANNVFGIVDVCPIGTTSISRSGDKLTCSCPKGYGVGGLCRRSVPGLQESVGVCEQCYSTGNSAETAFMIIGIISVLICGMLICGGLGRKCVKTVYDRNNPSDQTDYSSMP